MTTTASYHHRPFIIRSILLRKYTPGSMPLLNTRSLATRVFQPTSLASSLRKSPVLVSTPSLSIRHYIGKKSTRTVRLIAREDFPNGKAFKNEVVNVKPGFARNYLVPQKFAVYATKQNFLKYGIKDPNEETPEEKQARLEKEALDGNNEESKQAIILQKYLSNKELTIWRVTTPDTDEVAADTRGVDAQVVREKLSKQLKIDLEDHEKIHLKNERLRMDDITEEDIEKMVEEMPTDEECQAQIRRLGSYLACISLAGAHRVHLKVKVVQR